MRKKLTILAIILAVVAIYSGFWYMQGQRFKQSVALLLNDIATELHAKDMEFIYGELRVSGFPFSHQVYVHQPRFIGDQYAVPYDVASHQPIIVSMSLLANGFSLYLPRHIEVLKHDKEAETTYQLLFFTQPSFEVGLSYEESLIRLWQFWIGGAMDNFAFYMDGALLNEVSFQSEALSVMAVRDGSKILGLRQLQFTYEEDRHADGQLDVGLSWLLNHLESEPLLKPAWESDVPFGVLHSRGKLSLDLPEMGEDVIKEASVAAIDAEYAEILTPHFDVSLTGDLAIDENMSSSDKPLTLSLKHYEKAVDYILAFYQHYVASQSETTHAKNDAVRIKRALKILAEERLDNESSLVLRLDSANGGEGNVLTIGGYTTQEAQHIWKTGDSATSSEVNEAEASAIEGAVVPSEEINKQLEQQGADEESDTVYEYPSPGGRRR